MPEFFFFLQLVMRAIRNAQCRDYGFLFSVCRRFARDQMSKVHQRWW